GRGGAAGAGVRRDRGAHGGSDRRGGQPAGAARLRGGVRLTRAGEAAPRRAGPNSAAGRRGRPRSAYEAPRAAADRSTRFIAAESKRRGCPRLPAPPSRVTLLTRLVPVVLRLVRSLGRDADVRCLLGGDPGALHTQLP